MSDDVATMMRRLAPALRRVIEIKGDNHVFVAPNYPSVLGERDGRAVGVIAGHEHGALLLAWASLWAEAAFPQVAMGHKLAASLMATSMAGDASSQVQLPWNAFVIGVPDGLVRAQPAPGRDVESITRILVLRWPSGKVTLLMTGYSGIWSSGIRALEEIGEVIPGDSLESILAGGRHPLDETDERALRVLDRLFLGVCAELTLPHAQAAIQKHRASSSASSPRGEPKTWTYTLRREVKVDCREAVKAYVSGATKQSPAVQTLVRGHWRRVRHGANGELTKWTPIDPYWRGPEDAPIVARPHVIVADGAANDGRE